MPGSTPPQASFGRDMTTGSIPRHLVAFSLPMLAGNALQTAYSFINAIWVGRFLGKTALAAVTVSFPIVFVLMALGAGLTLATNILVSQEYGGQNFAGVRRVVQNSTALLTVLALALVAAGEFFAGHILRAMGTPPDVFGPAVAYLRIFFLSMIPSFWLFLTRAMLLGIGDSTTPLSFLSVSVLLTAILDPVLMFGWLGFPALGLNGTAWAAVIAQTTGLWLLVVHLKNKRSPVRPSLGLSGFHLPTTAVTVRIGIPSAVQQSLVSLGMVFVTGIVNSFGEDATAAFGVGSRIDQLAFMPAMTLSMAVATVAGQNIGARRYERIREIFWWGCLISCGITLCVSALAVSAPGHLASIFTTDAAVIGLATRYLRIVGSCYGFFAVMFISNGIINGAGHTLVTTAFSLVSLWVVRVPVAYVLSRRMGGVEGVWYAMGLSFFISMASSIAYYRTGRWRTPVGVRKPVVPVAAFGEETGEA